MLDINKTRKNISNHLKILTGSTFRNNGTGGNLLQLGVKDGKLVTASLGFKHTLVLEETIEGEVSETELCAIEPVRLGKVLQYMGDSLSFKDEEKSVTFFNNDSQVKLYKLGLQEDFKVSMDVIEFNKEEARAKGVKLDKKEFISIVKTLMSASGEVEDFELYNVVSLNFRDNGKAFTGSNSTYFRTDFDLGGLGVVIDKGTASLILSLEEAEGEELFIFKDEDKDCVYYVVGDSLLKVEGIDDDLVSDKVLENFDTLTKDSQIYLDLDTFVRQVKLANTLSENGVVDVIIEDGKGEIRSGVGGNAMDISKGEFNADEGLNLAFTVMSDELLSILGVMKGEVNVYINGDEDSISKRLIVETEDKVSYGVIEVKDI